MKIIEVDERNSSSSEYWSRSSPLTYRISIKIDDFDLILKREYFYVGFNDGEEFDDFYFDNEVAWRDRLGITRATFLTRNFDPTYLQEKEKELIEIFYKKLIKSEDNFKKELNKQIKNLNRDIKKYQDYQKDNLFVKIVRKKKLENIN